MRKLSSNAVRGSVCRRESHTVYKTVSFVGLLLLVVFTKGARVKAYWLKYLSYMQESPGPP